jgi:hypothetical protein
VKQRAKSLARLLARLNLVGGAGGSAQKLQIGRENLERKQLENGEKLLLAKLCLQNVVVVLTLFQASSNGYYSAFTFG